MGAASASDASDAERMSEVFMISAAQANAERVASDVEMPDLYRNMEGGRSRIGVVQGIVGRQREQSPASQQSGAWV